MSVPEFNLVLSKYCNELGSDDKRQRKRALENIKKTLLKQAVGNDNFIVYFEQVLRYLISSFKDSSENVRETAVVIMTELLKKVPIKELYISSLMPVISERLSGEITVETSEEVRLCLILLLSELISTYTKYLHHYLDDFVNIFVKTIVDPYPKVKKESCDCAAALAKAIPQYFHMQSESVINPLVHSLSHQQYRVRVAGIHSIGAVVRFGNNKSVNEVCGPLAERLFDQHHAVRAAVSNVVGMWLLELPDRYSYFHKLIPLMLTSLTEEIPELRKEAEELWNKIGQQFLLENETDLKEKLDYLDVNLDHYPANSCRPNLGCRVLVQRELSKYLPAMVVELEDWKVDVRVKSAQLMCVTIQHAESTITQHLEKTLPALYRACGDSDTRVSDNIELAAKMIGYFVPPDVYCRLMLPVVQDLSSFGPLRVLGAVISSSLQTEIKPQLPIIMELLASDTVCHTRQGEYQKQLLNALNALERVAKEDLSQVSREMFTSLVSVLGLASEVVIGNLAKELVENLAELNGITTQELYKQYTPELLEKLGANVQEWSLHTPQRFIFEALLTNSGAAVGLNIVKILTLLETCLKQENEPEAVLQVLIAISYILTHSEETLCETQDLPSFVEVLCTRSLQQQLVWRAGRSAEALRTAAVGCVLTALQLVPCSRSLADSLLPQLLALVEDSAFKTRQFSMLSLLNLVKALKSSSSLSAQDINTVFIVVLKRLDDNNDKVREAAVQTLCQLFTPPLPADYSIDCYRSSIESLYDTMLLHLDDPVPTFQNIMLDALKEVSKIHPKLLQSRIKIDNFRSKQKCEELISYLDSLHL